MDTIVQALFSLSSWKCEEADECIDDVGGLLFISVLVVEHDTLESITTAAMRKYPDAGERCLRGLF